MSIMSDQHIGRKCIHLHAIAVLQARADLLLLRVKGMMERCKFGITWNDRERNVQIRKTTNSHGCDKHMKKL